MNGRERKMEIAKINMKATCTRRMRTTVKTTIYIMTEILEMETICSKATPHAKDVGVPLKTNGTGYGSASITMALTIGASKKLGNGGS